MGKQKLTPRMVRTIIELLLEGNLTHQKIADRINHSLLANRTSQLRPAKTIKRSLITKINCTLKNKAKSAHRWTDVIEDYLHDNPTVKKRLDGTTNLDEIFKTTEL